jgi:hypothetical protein
MRALGFVYQDNGFTFRETMGQPLELVVGVQKNLHSDTYQIPVQIVITSPFAQSRREVFIHGTLWSDGIRQRNSNWWLPESLPEALAALDRVALPWFREWSKASVLAEKIETAIRERKHLVDVFEPLSPEQRELIARVWPRPVDPDWQGPSRTFYFASVLHYLAGNRERAINRTRDWLARLGPDENNERAQAQAQLNSLE